MNRANPVRDHVRALPDDALKALVTELAFASALQQSMLVAARRETNRRAKAAKATTAP